LSLQIHAEKDRRWMMIDPEADFGVYPGTNKSSSTLDEWELHDDHPLDRCCSGWKVLR
jgi:hypothetical protein